MSTGRTTPLISGFFKIARAISAISSGIIEMPSGFFAAISAKSPSLAYSVATKPGQSALQVTPERACTPATDLTSEEIPVFAAPYAAFVRKHRTDSVLVPPNKSILPHAFLIIRGKAVETRAPGKVRFAYTTDSHSSPLVSSMGFCKKGPHATHRISESSACLQTIPQLSRLSRE